MIRRLLPLSLVWVALVAAVPPEPVPVELATPDLTQLVPLAAAPIDKPPLAIPDLPLPDPPQTVPELPPPQPVFDATIATPTAPLRDLSCGVPNLLLKMAPAATIVRCGQERFRNGRYEEARVLLEFAGIEREGRYWMAETLFRLDRIAEADRLFAQVAQEVARDALTPYAVHSGGWAALRLGDRTRALEAFNALLRPGSGAPLSLLPSIYRGRALALSMLGRYDDARQAWTALLLENTPRPVAREAMFWLGESLGRLGQFGAADEQLTRFTQGGSHPLLESSLLRLGWWRNAGGHPADAVKAYREVLTNFGQFPERDWANLGLAVAAVGAGDLAGAREAARALQEHSSPLLGPALFAVARSAAAKQPAEARRVNQELLARPLSPRERAWVLCADGELLRAEAKRDEARTRYELAYRGDPVGSVGWYARLRLAQLNFEYREFAPVQADVQELVKQPITAELRLAALLLAGEAAYYAGDQDAAIDAYRRFLGEFRTHPAAPSVMLSIGWAELRRGNENDARQIFADFARERPESPLAPDALVLAAELAAGAGDAATALEVLERMSERYTEHPRAEIARLNRAILLLRGGRAAEAEPLLRAFISRAPHSPQVGRARVALGVVLLTAHRPAEARDAFAEARRDGAGPLGPLGLGVAALALRRWDDAVAGFTEARDVGPAAVGAAAEYGLAVVAFNRGQRDDFAKLAAGLIASGRATAPVLYALVVIDVERKAWDDALAAAKRLVAAYPAHATADSALARVGLGAATEQRWPQAKEALTLLRRQYSKSPFADQAVLPSAEAQLETGAFPAARETLEAFVAGTSSDPRLSRAWFLLARARDETGDRPGAVEAYSRAARDGQGPEWTTAVRLRFARLLAAERRWKDARVALEAVIKSDDAAAATEAAFYQGEAFRAEGNPSAAVEYYMTAAYLQPESPFGRRALLAAGGAYVALQQPEAAAIAYQKLLAQANLPPDLAKRARDELAKLGPR